MDILGVHKQYPDNSSQLELLKSMQKALVQMLEKIFHLKQAPLHAFHSN
jgi:hypothetical protein